MSSVADRGKLCLVLSTYQRLSRCLKMSDIYEGLSAEAVAELDRQDAEADAAMAEAEGRWEDGGCDWIRGDGW